MTKINLHGILKYEFGEVIPLNITRPKEVIDAIDSIKKDFRIRVYQLARENVHFNIIADGESVKNFNQLEMKKNFKQIDIVPMVAGGVFVIDDIIIMAAINIAIMVASMAIQMAMRPKPPKPEQLQSEVSAGKQSFLISSNTNLAQQGVPVPVGYGRLRVGSYVIQSSVKSYHQTQQISAILPTNSDTQSITNQISF
jgi:predicted phage tail protein